MVTWVTLGRHRDMAADSSLLADRPSVGDAVDAVAPSGASAFYGPLAAAMERIVGLAATALRAPFAFILLTGDDRRCFAAGPQIPDWTPTTPARSGAPGSSSGSSAAPWRCAT